MDNFYGMRKGKKGFSLKEIKKLIEQNEKNDEYNLIIRFYRELLLVSEIIDNQYEDKDIKRKMGFYFKNQDEIPYIKPLTLFKIDGKEIKFITGNKDYFYKEKNIENELYLKQGKWYVNISKEPCDKLFKIDELYFHGKKVKARNIKVSSEPSALTGKKNTRLINDFLDLELSKYKLRKKTKQGQVENKDSNFKKDISKYSKQPIGIQYIYSKLQKEEPIFFLDFDGKLRSIWTLTNMEKDSLNIRTKDNIIFTTEEKPKLITQTFLTDNGYRSIKLEGNDILYEGEKIKKLAKKIFYKKNLNPTTNISNFDEGIIFITKRKTYRFEKTITFESSNSTNEVLTKAIAYKSKKDKSFIFEANYAEPFNNQSYQNSEYNIMLKHDSFPINKDYIVLYKEQIEEIKQYNSFYTKDDIYKKYKPNIKIGNVDISIFREGTKLVNLPPLQDNTILMTAPKSKTIKCNYLKILYRFRNSIAHGEFKILDDKIIFWNTHSSRDSKEKETILKAQILKKDIDSFLKELRNNTLDTQLLKGKKMLLHIPHSNTTIPSYEKKMAKDKKVLESIEKYTDHRTNELFHYDGAERVEYGYSRVFCDVEKLEENEPMEALGLGILYEVSKKSRKYSEKALLTYKEHHQKLLETTLRQRNMFGKMVIIDCHSFSNEQAEEQGFSSDIPDICLGIDDIHTSSGLLTLCKEHFEKDAYSIGINSPFSGTIIPLELYGDKDILSIMIEVNKAVYTDDEGFDRLKRSIGVLLKEIDFFYD